MPRRREATGASRTSASAEVPVELLAGPCLEVWADPKAEESSRPASTFRRYHTALYAWLEAHGIERGDHKLIPPALTRQGASPWSYYYVAAHRPDDLAGMLERRGLPPDWKPTRVTSYDYGPSLVPQKSNKWRTRGAADGR